MNDTYTPQISIIVPVYDIRDYILKCLNSLTSQTLQDIEIIIIDDGSTDGSGTICDKFAVTDPRIRVIHKHHEGLSAARNDGLEIARAEYILFVDGDDWAEPDLCEKTFRAAHDNRADLVAFQYYRHEKGRMTKKLPFPKEGITDRRLALTDYWDYVYVAVWNKLYHRRLFDKIRFPVGCLCEDVAVTHRLIYRAQRILLINEYLYHHLVDRPGGIMNSRSPQLFEDAAFFNLRRLGDLRRLGYISDDREAEGALSYRLTMGRYAKLSGYCDRNLRKTRHLSPKASRKKRIIFRVYKLSPMLFDLVTWVWGKRRGR